MKGMKIKIAIADDEKIILRSFCKILGELKDKTEICGTASDGEELKRIIETEQPNLVITDICMPKLSGLEIIKQCSNMPNKPLFVLISGYKDFEYAREAMTYGVSEYLIKPVDPSALISLVKKLHNEIITKKSSNALYNMDFPVEEDNASSTHYRVVIAECENTSDVPTLEAFVNNTMPESCMLLRYKAHICIVFPFSGSENNFAKALNYAKLLLEKAGISADYAVGEPYRGFNGIVHSYNSACRALEMSFFFDENKVYSEEDRNHLCPSGTYDASAVSERIFSEVHRGDTKSAFEELENFTKMILNASGGVRDIAVIQFYSVVDKLRKLISDTSLMDKYSPEATLGFIKECKRNIRIKEFLYEMINDITNQNSDSKSVRNSFEIKLITEYIHSHLNENLTVESVAKMAYKNTYYFSTFFKKYTNENFKDYVLRVRMEKAMEELEHSDKKIHEIAEEVGFIDPHHFSRVFKKYYGFTASSVRKE
ncbi:MAG: response regulator [Clostridia bacterium]|nr:response regulator [Clostridia bacterium]